LLTEESDKYVSAQAAWQLEQTIAWREGIAWLDSNMCSSRENMSQEHGARAAYERISLKLWRS